MEQSTNEFRLKKKTILLDCWEKLYQALFSTKFYSFYTFLTDSLQIFANKIVMLWNKIKRKWWHHLTPYSIPYALFFELKKTNPPNGMSMTMGALNAKNNKHKYPHFRKAQNLNHLQCAFPFVFCLTYFFLFLHPFLPSPFDCFSFKCVWACKLCWINKR